MINVLLVEDHELYRMGLTMLLDKADGINLAAQAADGIDGIKKAREISPDVILMDIGLPNIDGIEATMRIKEFNPDVKVLIFTSRDSENDVFEAFKAGADGYIMKGATPAQLTSAIRAIKDGTAWLDPAIAKMVPHGHGLPQRLEKLLSRKAAMPSPSVAQLAAMPMHTLTTTTTLM